MGPTKRALVIGASGQVGRCAAGALRARGWEVTGTYASRPGPGLRPLDLLRDDDLRALVAEARPDVCLVSSALTNVDRCEEERELAFATNARAPGVAAEACRAAGGRVIFLSTEYVFDGSAGPYREDDPPSPACAYGESKLEGERRVLAADPRNLAVRTTVVYSHHPGDRNFAMQLLGRLGAGERMRVPVDQVSSPTYAPDLGAALAELAERGVSGVLNVVGPDVLDRYDFARRAARTLGLREDLLEPVLTAALAQKARRPLRAGLRVERLAALGIALRGVDEALRDLSRRARGEPGEPGEPARGRPPDVP